MQIAFRHLQNCSPTQKRVSVLIYDVRTSSVIRYLRSFQLCTTFCIVCCGSFSYLYHSYNVKFWVRIRVLRRRTRSSNVFYPAVSVWTSGKHGWEGYQRWKSFCLLACINSFLQLKQIFYFNIFYLHIISKKTLVTSKSYKTLHCCLKSALHCWCFSGLLTCTSC